jgi:signal transduction histidine kinase
MLIVLMRTDFLEPLSQLRDTILWGSLGAALLAGLLAAGLATNIALPLERLSRAALRIQRGQWDKEVGLEKGVELNRLARAMERMRTGIVQRDEQVRLMLAQVAHEIRNPLGGLELFASIALETEDREDRIRLMERVRKEVEALNGIINDFLAFSRPLHPEVQLHDVRAPLQAATEWVDHQVGAKGGELIVTLPTVPLFVRADPDHVKRAVINLLQNAAQAGTNVWLDAWVRRVEVIVAVRDDGPGVAPELAERIFHPFVTDKEKGAGLGLAIVKRMLEANGARIVLMDPLTNPDPGAPLKPGGFGAQFRIYFQGSEHLPARE